MSQFIIGGSVIPSRYETQVEEQMSVCVDPDGKVDYSFITGLDDALDLVEADPARRIPNFGEGDPGLLPQPFSVFSQSDLAFYVSEKGIETKSFNDIKKNLSKVDKINTLINLSISRRISNNPASIGQYSLYMTMLLSSDLEDECNKIRNSKYCYILGVDELGKSICFRMQKNSNLVVDGVNISESFSTVNLSMDVLFVNFTNPR